MEATIGRATDTYGLFATVIGLLSWLSLAAQLVLIAAEPERGARPRPLAAITDPGR